MTTPPITLTPGQPARSWPHPNRPLPFADYDDYDDYDDYEDSPPEGWKLEDVEIVWWTLASRMSKKELRVRLAKVVEEKYFQRHNCFRYIPVADNKGRGRYPRGVMLLLKQILKPYRGMFVHKEYNALRIQLTIWNTLTLAVLEWCPAQWLPEHLVVAKLEMDLGL